MRTPIPPDDLELLSAYLDGELPESARAALESRLDSEPTLRDALDDLRRTVQILKAAPAIKPPRNFTLDPARYRRRAPWWARYNTMRLAGALGAFASIVLIALGVFTMSLSGNAAPTIQNAAGVAFAATATAGVQDKTFSAEAASSIPTQPLTATLARITASPAVAASITQTALPTATLLPTGAALTDATPQNADTMSMPAPAPAVPATNDTAAKSGAGAIAPLQPMATQGLPPTEDAAANAADSSAAESPGDQSTQGGAAAGDQAGENTQPPNQRQPKQQPSPQAFVPAPTNVPLTPTPAQETRASTASEIGKDTESLTPSSAPTQGQAVALAPTTLPASPGNQQGAIFTRSGAGSQLLLIGGIALLIFSSMLFAIGWMRARL
ncbi:MAG: hypothetical protein IT324_16825 [Anaerolineae bacterium]|nr:hypothetical protein [Anaerolineae bacterium]